MNRPRTIGIENRVSIATLDLALRATLNKRDSPAYFQELADAECNGANRVKKAKRAINRIAKGSILILDPEEEKEKVEWMLERKSDRSLLFVAMMCAAYPLFFDTVTILGRLFRAQKQVGRPYLFSKLGELYGNNRSLAVAFDCVMPMLIEAGFIIRPLPGVYEIVRQERATEAARNIYLKSFLTYHPDYETMEQVIDNPYFEFINAR